MSDQWVVVMDREKGDDPQYEDIENGDRVLYITGSRVAIARVERIERKVRR